MSPALSTDPAGVVLTFLQSIGRRADAEFYLRLFRQLPKESFAVIAAEASVVEHTADSVAAQVRFLGSLGLFAPIVVGLLAPDAAHHAGKQLAERLADRGAELHGAADHALAQKVRDGLQNERLPVISLDRISGEPRTRFAWLGETMGQLGTRKLAILTSQGGIGPKNGSPLALGDGHVLTTHHSGISVINLTTDYEPLRVSGCLQTGEQLLLDEIRSLLLRNDCARTVASITSPLSLLRELFTVKGAGTLVKRGTRIVKHASYASVDTSRLRELLESSFGRKLQAGFFDKPPLAAYIEEGYRGAAILVQSPIAPFLTKFAVGRLAQGEGMGRDLWQAMTRDHPRLFWRAHPENPVSSWYDKVCDGMVHTNRYKVYWRGISYDQIPNVIDAAATRPDDFERAS